MLPDSVMLTTKQLWELSDLEQEYHAILSTSQHQIPFQAYELIESFGIDETSNIGIHYFCLENDAGLRYLATNKHISLEVALLIFEKSLSDKTPTISRNSIQRGLLFNPVVYHDLELFKLIFSKNTATISSSLFALRPVADYAPINVFMFLLPKIVEASLTAHYMPLVNSRFEEILAWVAVNKPELAGLPLSWVMRAYGFNEKIAETETLLN